MLTFCWQQQQQQQTIYIKVSSFHLFIYSLFGISISFNEKKTKWEYIMDELNAHTCVSIVHDGRGYQIIIMIMMMIRIWNGYDRF